MVMRFSCKPPVHRFFRQAWEKSPPTLLNFPSPCSPKNLHTFSSSDDTEASLGCAYQMDATIQSCTYQSLREVHFGVSRLFLCLPCPCPQGEVLYLHIVHIFSRTDNFRVWIVNHGVRVRLKQDQGVTRKRTCSGLPQPSRVRLRFWQGRDASGCVYHPARVFTSPLYPISGTCGGNGAR